MERLVKESIEFKRGVEPKKALFSDEKRQELMEKDFHYLQDVWKERGYPIDHNFEVWKIRSSIYYTRFSMAGRKYELIGAMPGKKTGFVGWENSYPWAEEGWNIKQGWDDKGKAVLKGSTPKEVIDWINPLWKQYLENSINWHRLKLEETENLLEKL